MDFQVNTNLKTITKSPDSPSRVFNSPASGLGVESHEAAAAAMAAATTTVCVYIQ